MFTINDVPKLGTTVQIKHGGLEDWVTIKVMSDPIQGPNGWGVEVEYIDIPEWLSSDGVTNNNVNYQWNLQEAQIKPVSLTNEQVLKTFLKKHRVLTKYRHNVKHFNLGTDTPIEVILVDNAINEAFDWFSSTGNTSAWMSIHVEWRKLVEHFNLEGTVNITKL